MQEHMQQRLRNRGNTRSREVHDIGDNHDELAAQGRMVRGTNLLARQPCGQRNEEVRLDRALC